MELMYHSKLQGGNDSNAAVLVSALTEIEALKEVGQVEAKGDQFLLVEDYNAARGELLDYTKDGRSSYSFFQRQ